MNTSGGVTTYLLLIGSLIQQQRAYAEESVKLKIASAGWKNRCIPGCCFTRSFDGNFKQKFDLLTARQTYFAIGGLTVLTYAQQSTEIGERKIACYLLPFGLAYPLSVGQNHILAFESNFFLLPVNANKDDPETETQPMLAELALTYTPGKAAMISAGYRRVLNPGGLSPLYQDLEKGSFFLDLTVGAIFSANERTINVNRMHVSQARADQIEEETQKAKGREIVLKIRNENIDSFLDKQDVESIESTIEDILMQSGFVVVSDRKQAKGMIDIVLSRKTANYESWPSTGSFGALVKYKEGYRQTTVDRLEWTIVWSEIDADRILEHDEYHPRFPSSVGQFDSLYEDDLQRLYERIELRYIPVDENDWPTPEDVSQ